MVREILARDGFRVSGEIPGDPEIPLTFDVSPPDGGESLFRIHIRQDGDRIRAGVSRPGEKVYLGWPMDARGGHVDGRCFQFFDPDASREERFLERVKAEAALHVPASGQEVQTLAELIGALLPGAEAGAVHAVAEAVATGLSDGQPEALHRRLKAIMEPSSAPSP